MRYGIFCWYKVAGAFWFRLFGYGIAFKRSDTFLFSERNGIGIFKIGNYGIKFLKPMA